jgi:hypothetical protein
LLQEYCWNDQGLATSRSYRGLTVLRPRRYYHYFSLFAVSEVDGRRKTELTHDSDSEETLTNYESKFNLTRSQGPAWVLVPGRVG